MENKVLTVNIRETNEQARRRVYKSKQLDKKIDLIISFINIFKLKRSNLSFLVVNDNRRF